jgi:EmrB/QacA subfamily drug resistance transporter
MEQIEKGLLPKRELYFVFGALMLGMLLAALDGTIVSTALPTIVGDLHGSSHLAWVVVAYLLATTVSTPMWGKLGDLYGRKQFFQWAIVLFLLGSVLCGFSTSMFELILFRALQGLGGGGLMVGAQAVIADIVPPRDRGRYAGMFGGVFGAATVLGPLLGGVIVEYWSWRWIFFVNVPFGIVALFVTAAALPKSRERVAHVLDFAGTLVMTVSASALILFTSLGGSTFAWTSWISMALLAVGLVAGVAFVVIERRAVEPILPPRLFANRVFSSASAIGFVVGFAMFGSMTFLPYFFQTVRHVTPTQSGLRLLPLMAGLFGMSILVGSLVSRGKPYRPFPILGTVVMTLGLALLGTVGIVTSSYVMSLYMLILGMGIGLVMQVLVTAVQNAVNPADIGAATAGTNFFRSIGGSFGTAIFGALYTNSFPQQIASGFAKLGVPVPKHLLSTLTPKNLSLLPPAELHAVLAAIATSIQTVYHWAIPVGVIAVALSLTLPEIKLRASLHPVADEVPMSHAEPLL